ncbi:TPA: AAA family ATPase, partial [Acinetobacter baumannii]|nr:AAA family ATPase [Acinetobacter baumannii]
MSKLKSIRIENIRSLMDTSDIQLKPLTVLVGRNSVGKSTFARIFPLLRQSSEANKKSPILWYGKYVDFGDYETAINKENINNGIALSFNLSIEPLELIGIFDFDYSIRGNLSYTIFKK